MIRLFVVLMFAVTASGCAGLRERMATPTFPIPPVRQAAPVTKSLESFGRGYHAEGAWFMELRSPGGMTALAAAKVTGKWPDGTRVVIYDRDTDGPLPPEVVAERVKTYEEKWYRLRDAAKK